MLWGSQDQKKTCRSTWWQSSWGWASKPGIPAQVSNRERNVPTDGSVSLLLMKLATVIDLMKQASWSYLWLPCLNSWLLSEFMHIIKTWVLNIIFCYSFGGGLGAYPGVPRSKSWLQSGIKVGGLKGCWGSNSDLWDARHVPCLLYSLQTHYIYYYMYKLQRMSSF